MPQDIGIKMNMTKEIREDIINFINKIPYVVQSKKNKNIYYICGSDTLFEYMKDRVERDLDVRYDAYIAVGEGVITVTQEYRSGFEEILKDIYKIVKYIIEKYKDRITKIDDDFMCDWTEKFLTEGIDCLYHPEQWEDQ